MRNVVSLNDFASTKKSYILCSLHNSEPDLFNEQESLTNLIKKQFETPLKLK